MKTKTKKSKKGELLIVQDFTPFLEAIEAGELTPEEWEKIFATEFRTGKVMNTDDGEKYLDLFKDKGTRPFLGASNAGVIIGKSHFKSRKFLQLQLLGQVKEITPPSRQWVFDLGHEAESFVGSMGTRMLRKQGLDVSYKSCINGMIDTRWPDVLIHPDGYIVDRKTGTLLMLAEVKTSADMSPYWLNDFSRGIVPEDYVAQVQVEMQILSRNIDITRCCVLVWNKTGDEEGFRQYFVDRDEEEAVRILDEMEKFVEDTANGILYDEDLLPEEIAAVYGEEDKSLGYVTIPKKHEKTLQALSRLAEEKAALKAEIAEVEALIADIEKEEKLYKARLYSAIGKAPGGTCRIGNDVYHIDIRRSYSLDADVKRMAEEQFPEAWAAIKAFKPLVSTRVTKVPVEIDPEATDASF